MVNQDPAQRHDHLCRMYAILAQLVMHEGRFISERTNNFLLFNSILFGGFLLLATRANTFTVWASILSIALPVAGIVISFFHFVIIYRNVDAANFWRSTIRLIEEDPDFWEVKAEKDTDLDLFSARSRYLSAAQTRQQQHPLKLSGPPQILEKKPFRSLSLRYLQPNQIFGWWLPILVSILWLLAIIWGCVES